MTEGFQLPPGMCGRFAVVKLWPAIKTAEDECIARLKIAARMLRIECVEVHADGRLIEAPETRITRADVDFVLHLHYDTPKLYDAFSLVALWNPLRFYFEWGYQRTSRNLTTHDDFVSCDSIAADDHVARMIRGQATHLPPLFRLFHSTADVVHPPSLGEGQLFYAGINWEALGGGKSRHQEVLKRLDDTGLLRIYGPTVFQGVRVWAGYRSYVGEVPFDGVSMIDEIAKAGIALVLSSQAHKDSELMSNRLFESIAAGALVICDENPFARRHFGDALLYIDGRSPAEQIEQDIRAHLQWARANPSAALAKATRAQEIFRERFTLLHNLRDLYEGLPARHRALFERRHPASTGALRVQLLLLMPEYRPDVLQAHLESARIQSHTGVQARLVVDANLPPRELAAITQALGAFQDRIGLVHADFQHIEPESGIGRKRRLGAVVLQLLPELSEADALVLVAPNERLWSNHIEVLAGALERDPSLAAAATAAVLQSGSAPVHDVHECIVFGSPAGRDRTGLGRFIFRRSAIPSDIAIVLRHVDGLVAAALLGEGRLAQQLPASITILPDDAMPVDAATHVADIEAVRDFAAAALEPRFGFGTRPEPLASSASPMSIEPKSVFRLLVKACRPDWWRLQYHALRQHGAAARWIALRRRLGLA
ncbi:glycosyltransferase family 1 protein [Ramlibacter sp. AW1]|uniref:Glycosyltransferase family 1 protein n=1 Tax=Ramlibacter aurantiacus TaxID=2801330 RepID=A0A936ZRG2_9BURK|nr:glycosyltransferase [Ramlibacter aurantiacus]MBL0422260.1 glycosyltransferase family 1 protein [Ramlibacter aurantiacus]